MKSRNLTAAVLVVAAAIACLAAPSPARALGIGFYGSAGGGTADWNNTGYYDYDDHRDTRHGGAGLVIDTGSPYNPLSYRLSIGWERISHLSTFETPGFTLEGVVVDQDLMVDLIGGAGPLRMWVGPELRLGFLTGEPDDGSSGEEDFLALGIGPVIGFDFMVSPALALSWKFGYLVTGYSGNSHSEYDYYDDSSLGEGHAYASLAILFSTWGGYSQPQPVQQQRQQQPPAAQRPYPGRW